MELPSQCEVQQNHFSATAISSRSGSNRYRTRRFAAAKTDNSSKSDQSSSFQAESPSEGVWVLIEWEKSNDQDSSYAVIHSTEIVGRASSNGGDLSSAERREMGYFTGNLIYVQHREQILNATVVIVSDDKKFIDTELQQLRRMAASNTTSKSSTQVNPPQQRRLSVVHTNQPEPSFYSQNPPAPSAKRICRSDSVSSFAESLYAPSSSEKSISAAPTPTMTYDVHGGSSWPGPAAPERTIVPWPHRITHPAAVVLPMTFDQQTQTIESVSKQDATASSSDVQLRKVLSYLETILAEQKTSRMEREYDRQLLQELHERLFAQDKLLNELVEGNRAQHRPTTNASAINTEANVVSSSAIRQEIVMIDSCSVSDETGRFIGSATSSECVGFSSQQEVQVDANANQTWPLSGVDKPEHACSMDGSGSAVLKPINYVFVESGEHFAKPLPDQHQQGKLEPKRVEEADAAQSTMPTLPLADGLRNCHVSESNFIEDLKGDWDDPVEPDGQSERRLASADDNGEKIPAPPEGSQRQKEALPPKDPEHALIGPNGTLVPQDVLKSINWSNYKCATRRLLVAVFGRNVLATHSLTGRPSPVMRGFSNSQGKHRLDANKVADLVETVCKMCSVEESMVRNVITTKCGDENKMQKMKSAKLLKQRKKSQDGPSQTNATGLARNKENIG